MKRYAVLLLLFGLVVTGTAQIVTLAPLAPPPPLECTLTWNQPTGATSVVVNCLADGSSILSDAKISLTTIVSSSVPPDTTVILTVKYRRDIITIEVWRVSATAPVHIEAAVNGTLSFREDLPVP